MTQRERQDNEIRKGKKYGEKIKIKKGKNMERNGEGKSRMKKT